MPVAEYTKRAIKKYKEANYEFFNLRLLKGEKDILKAKADAEGKSLNQYIRDKILED